MGNLLYWRAFVISCHVTLSGVMSVSIHEVYDAVARGGASCVSTKVVSTCLENVCVHQLRVSSVCLAGCARRVQRPTFSFTVLGVVASFCKKLGAILVEVNSARQHGSLRQQELSCWRRLHGINYNGHP